VVTSSQDHAPHGDAEPIRLHLLGPLALSATPLGGTDRVLHQPKRLALLAYLALGRNWH
jgi:DNA-binding SARP family transcriptional activator